MFPPSTSGGGDPLGMPPPSPTPMNPDGQGSAPASLRGLGGAASGGMIPSNQLPPEILTGITAAALQIDQMLSSFAQATPDKAQALDAIKALLQQYLAELMSAGGGAATPTASGPAFPGGGIPRGIAGPGAV